MFNMIVGKKQIILACLVLALGVAVYLNWRIVDNGGYTASGVVNTQTDDTDAAKKYGDAQYVDKPQIQDGEAYFTQATLSRQKSRDQAIETLQTMLNDQKIDETIKANLAIEATQIAKAIEAESEIENMVISKGIANCMAYIDGENINLIVKSAGLLDNEVAQIRDIVLKETVIPVENISIVEVK